MGAPLRSVRFAELGRALAEAAEDQGLTAPAFRSPPRSPGVRRSIQRRPDGTATVAVAVRGRPAGVVAADLIDGILAANSGGESKSSAELGAVRDLLWAAAAQVLDAPVPAPVEAPLFEAESEPGGGSGVIADGVGWAAA